MTLATWCFKYDKERGLVSKAGTGAFFDGNTETRRVIWHNADNGKLYVILRGEAYEFKPYPADCQIDGYGYTIGHI